ncbi:hypothetical protein BC937DRAFT_94755 [Endogone sp. FLAS-F59071]|nr:hypothetical protein BC937DRAFT_94755 [Endogone sp. FLAS-F59071]|eukprot:RUS13799.1 hypothetical protein BC937DRAFT_94755 [Endogone sp. FLAS-F59071]
MVIAFDDENKNAKLSLRVFEVLDALYKEQHEAEAHPGTNEYAPSYPPSSRYPSQRLPFPSSVLNTIFPSRHLFTHLPASFYKPPGTRNTVGTCSRRPPARPTAQSSRIY